jgi:O-antigen/teichoic acid export membrane protein
MTNANGQPGADAALPAGAPCARRIARNGAMTLLSMVGNNGLVNIIAVAALARGLGPDHMGVYYTIFSLVVTFQLISESVLATVPTFRIVQARERWKEAAAEGVGLLAVMGVLSAAVLLGIGAAWTALKADGDSLVPSFALAALACFAIQAQQLGWGVCRAFERFGFESVARLLQGLAFVVVLLLLAFRGDLGLESALAALAASHVLAALFMLVNVQRRWRCLGFRVNWGTTWDWLVQAIPLSLGDWFRRMTFQIDTFLLMLLQGSPAAVGLYNLACRPLAGMGLLPRAFLSVTFPAYVRLAQGKREDMAYAFARSTRLLWIASLPVSIGISLCAGPIVLLLGGPQFADAAAPLGILAWLMVMIFLSSQFRYLFAALDRQRLYVVLVGVTFLVETALEAALTPGWSYMGLSVGFVLGELLFLVAGLICCHRQGLRGVEWGRLLRAVPCAAGLAVVLWLARDWSLPLLVATGVAATAAYFVLCVVVGAFRAEEAERFASVFGVLFGRRRRRRQPPAPAEEPPLPADLPEPAPR